MFPKVTRRKNKNSTSTYLQLVEGYRDGDRVRQKVIISLGRLDSPKTEKTVRRLQKSLARLYPKPDGYIDLSEVENETVFEFGSLWALTHLWHKTGLEDLVARAQLKRGNPANRRGFDLARVVRRLVFNRCVDPLSRLGVVEKWAPEQIWQSYENPTPYQHWLRALGYVNEAKDSIERCFYDHAVDIFDQPSEILFYDLTSSYFEGTQADGAEFGYSRDHRADKLQIVIGVVTTKNGLPVGLNVFPGNTADKTTLKGMATNMKKRFSLPNCTFVGDRGLLTEANCYEILNMKSDFVMALPKRSSRSAVAKLVEEKPPQTWTVLPGQPTPKEDEEDLRLRVHDEIEEQMFRAQKPSGSIDAPLSTRPSISARVRRVFVYNPEKAKDDRAFRNQQIEKTEKRLAQINAMAMKANPSRQEEMTRKVALALSRHKTKQWFNATVITHKGKNQQLGLIWHRRQDVIEKEVCHDGVFVIVASLTRQELEAPETVQTYKNLVRVEWAFRHLKSQIDMRPVFVRSDAHVKGHVLIAFIAYYLRRSIEVRLEQSGEPLSAEKTLRELDRIKAVENRAGEVTFYGSTRPRQIAQSILSSLDIPLPPRNLIPKDLDAM